MPELNEIKRLREENERLQKLVGRDYLTGLYLRQVIEQRIDERLQKSKDGILLLIDVDAFKKINESFGHSAGDAVLCELARLLEHMFFSKDIIGRIGGDEFVVFTSPAHSTQFVLDKGERIIQQIAQYGKRLKMPLSVTMGVTYVQEGDSYERLFQRANRELANGKSCGGRRVSVASCDGEIGRDLVRDKKGGITQAIGKDITLIWNDLREAGDLRGAYCPGYENFMCIYRFVERGLMSSPNSIFAILLTLTDKNRELLAVEHRDMAMRALADVIGAALRLGDVYTRYSSSQFLLMVLDTSRSNAMRIVERIREGLENAMPKSLSIGIECAVHPLEPAHDEKNRVPDMRKFKALTEC